MQYTRIYSDKNGDSHFEDIVVPLSDEGSVGLLSAHFPVKFLQFRENPPNYNWDFHPAPFRQFIVLLDGEIEITTSLNKVWNFKGGDIILVEDIEGKGHKTKNVKQNLRKSLFIKL